MTTDPPLFSAGDAEDISYRNLRDSPNKRVAEIRAQCEQLWIEYKPFADDHFLIELRREFHSRFWEMYLAVTFIRLGYSICCPKPGPDVGIVVDGKRIWFEAVAPKSGDPDSPDSVPDLEFGKMNWVPNEKILLRYLNAIQKKLTEQYPRWRRANVVSEDDAFVVAINPRDIPHDTWDTIPPRIVQAAFPIGAPYVSLEGRTGAKLSEGHQRRFSITKLRGAKVSTGAFVHESGMALSGLLCSRVDAANQPGEMGANFQLVPNPLASVPLPTGFRLPGKYFPVDREGELLTVTFG
jgi:hypothetical protein